MKRVKYTEEEKKKARKIANAKNYAKNKKPCMKTIKKRELNTTQRIRKL